MKTMFSLIIFFLSCNVAIAGGVATKKTKIDRVVTIRNSKNVTVYLADGYTFNPAKCTKGDRLMAVLDDNFYGNRMYSALVTASASKQKVAFTILDNECVTSGSYTYPIIHAIHQYRQ